jgi:hypothetical protein
MENEDKYGLQRFAYKPRDACVPEGAEPEPEPEAGGSGQPHVLRSIFERDSELQDSAERLAKRAKAEGTMVNYTSMTKRFENFCGEKGYNFDDFSEQAVLHFVLSLDKAGVSHAVICQVKPALALVERLAGKKTTSFTPMVDTYIEAAKRRAAEQKGPARKAGELPEDVLDILRERLVKPDAKGRYDLAVVRTLLRVTVVKYTFCRFNCYDKLRACDVEDRGDSIRITFSSAKNDQMHRGSVSYIVKEDAVEFIRFAFRQLGFRMGEADDKAYLNCRIHRTKKRQVVIGHRRVSYTHATKMLRNMLTEVGIEAQTVTDKSFKMLGVTSILDNNTPLEDVMHHGRWRTLSMPLHYKINSEKYKKNVAKNV